MLNIPVEIKALLQADSVKKNFRVHFPNGEFVDLTNADIVSESVSFTESICSQSELKFGLCESPYIEFECVNIGNIKGATIECSIEIVCPSSVSGAVYRADIAEYVYPIPYGRFVVDECKKQADMSHRKIVAYSELELDPNNINERYRKSLVYSAKGNITYDMLKRIQTFHSSYLFDDITETNLLLTTKGATGNYRFGPNNSISVWLRWIGGSTGGDKICKLYPCNVTKTKEEFIEEVRDFLPNLDTIPGLKDFLEKIYGKGIVTNSDPIKWLVEPNSIVYSGDGTDGLYDRRLGNIIGVGIEKWEGGQQETTIFYANNEFADHRGEVKELNSDYFGMVTKTVPLTKTTINGATRYVTTETLTKEDITELSNACIEFTCSIGRINRDSTLSVLNLAEQTLADTFDNFVDVWYEDELTKPYGAVCCTWKDSSDEENYSIVYLNGYDEDTDTTTYQTYDLSDNYLIRESTWTDETIYAVLQRASEGLEGLQYMPMDMTIQGRPDIQSGDLLEVETDDTSFNTIVMQRTLKGVQSLLDDITSD